MIKNLALKGGGVKGIAYVGSLYELDKRGHFETLERVSGTSAGALVALMVALNLQPDQIEKLMRDLNFNDFKKGWNPFRIFTKYGLYSGDEILEFIYQCYETSALKIDKKATFKDLAEAGGKDVIVFASNLNKRNITEFSNYNTPDCILAEAVRASMSIPLFFKGWQFSNKIPDDHIYVDGGLMFNYPLSFFDKARFHNDPFALNKDSIGLFLEPKKLYEQFEDNPIGDDNENKSKGLKLLKKIPHIKKFTFNMWITSYIKYLFESLMNSQDIELFEENHLVNRTIFVDDLGISATKFNLTQKDIEDLMSSGRKGAIRYFNYIESLKNDTDPV